MWPLFLLLVQAEIQRKMEAKEAPATPTGSLWQKGAVLCGYWFEWEPRVNLADVPTEYNIVCIAFMTDGNRPTFTPHYTPETSIIEGIKKLKAQGQEVLISLGGASGHMALTEADKDAFKQELIALIDKYGFTGVDIDLEGESVQKADNARVIPAVLKEVKESYLAKGKSFMITMAPEFIYLRGPNALYQPYVDALDGYYDLIFPQYYNQGADGIWSDEMKAYLSQNDNERKAQFLYELTRAIVTGTKDFVKIPADKFAIGLPASPVSALNGYVENPEDVAWALNRLKEEGNGIRGLMTWSINHDAANGYEFLHRYAPLLGLGT